MPRSLEEILAHADEFADRFERYDPQPSDLRAPAPDVTSAALADYVRSVAEYARTANDPLSDLVQLRAQVERLIVETVQRLRVEQVPWKQIGQELGTTGEAARQRYQDLIKAR